jgi:hypothetical protein
MAFPIMNANSISMSVVDGLAGDANTYMFQLTLNTTGRGLFKTPAVVDVSGMEFQATIHQGAGTTQSVPAMASGASTVVVRFVDVASGDAGATITGLLFSADTSFTATTAANTQNVSEFSNTVDAGWVTGEMKQAVGTSTTDLDAEDIVALQTVRNISGAGGIGVLAVNVNYVYGKPGAVN